MPDTPTDPGHRRTATLDAIQEAVRASTDGSETARRRYEILADELRDRILSGELAEGVALPGEREFVERTGLGRGSVREAIRILESEGLLSPKSPGRYGQAVVLPVTDKGVHKQLELFIRGGAISSRDLLEVRIAVEPQLARLAATNRTDDDIARLREVTKAMEATPLDDRYTLKRLNFDWHVCVAAASHNELLRAFMTGISAIYDRGDNMEQHGTNDDSAAMIAAHTRIEAAIIARDPQAAQRRMARHLDAYAAGLGRHLPDRLDLNPGRER